MTDQQEKAYMAFVDLAAYALTAAQAIKEGNYSDPFWRGLEEQVLNCRLAESFYLGTREKGVRG